MNVPHAGVRAPVPWCLVVLAVLTLVGGCASSPPAHFYVLTPVANEAPARVSQLILGVGPIRLPAYLDQPQMVKRVTPNRVDVEELERWGGPLEREVTRVLAQNLTRLLGTARVVSHPWEGAIPVDVQIIAEVRRFDAGADGAVHLDAVWSLFEGEGRRLLYMTQASLSVPVSGADFDAIVQAQSQALGELSEAIARELVRLQGRSPNR